MRYDTDEAIRKVLKEQGIGIARSMDTAEYVLSYNGKEARLSDVDVYLAKGPMDLLKLLKDAIKELKNED